jgi:hypothetical protein
VLYLFGRPTLLALLSTARYLRPIGHPVVLPFHVVERFLRDENEDMITMLFPSNLYMLTFY